MKDEYRDYIKGNELLTIVEVLNAVTTRTISLLTSDVKTRKLIGVSREAVEEALKYLQIVPKILAKRSNVMWDLEAKKLAGSFLMTKSLWLQTEYVGTRQTRVTLHGEPMDINVDYVGAFFAMYGQVEEVARMTSKVGVPSGNFAVQVILDRTKFQEIPDILLCRGGKIFVVVEVRPYCCLCGTGRKPATTKEVVTKSKPAEDTDGSGECGEVIKKGSKVVALSPSP